MGAAQPGVSCEFGGGRPGAGGSSSLGTGVAPTSGDHRSGGYGWHFVGAEPAQNQIRGAGRDTTSGHCMPPAGVLAIFENSVPGVSLRADPGVAATAERGVIK